jgi:hypothetical protein
LRIPATFQVASLLAFSTIQLLYGQLDTGAISGTVRDSTGAVLQSATVKIVETQTGIAVSLLSNSDGFYSAPSLHIGKYNISASAAGFATETANDIDLQGAGPPESSTSRCTLGHNDHGGERWKAAAPILQTEDSSMGQVVDEETMENLPLNGRNYIQLATLGAGTSPSQRGAERDTFIANGARELQNTYLLDGVDNKNKIVGFDSSAAQAIEPVIDGVQEFKVETSTFSAEFGQAAGAVVNVTMKSGTNEYHGSMWEYIRNSFFDAKPYFQVLGQKPFYNQNQFGATFGAPIIKDRTFFFGSWQSLRSVDEVPQLATVPTLAQRSGVFTTADIRSELDRAESQRIGVCAHAFPEQHDSRQRLGRVSTQLLSVVSAAEPDWSASNYFSDQAERLWQTTNTTSGWITGSATKTPSSRAIRGPRARTFCPRRCRRRRAIPAMCGRMPVQLAASETHIFRPNLINELRFGYMETREIQQVPGINEDAEFGITGAPNYPEVHGLPTFAISGLNTLGTTGPGTLPLGATGSGNLPLNKQGKNQQFFDNLSWIKGRHTLKFGVDYRTSDAVWVCDSFRPPCFDFHGCLYPESTESRRHGIGVRGLPAWGGESAYRFHSTQELGKAAHCGSRYVQDDWKVSPKLTVNLGLRYELAMPWYEINNDFSDFILQPGPAFGLLVTAPDASQYGLRNSFATPDTKNFAPRAGLAYQSHQRR